MKIGGYVITGVIGAGSSAVVYVAEDAEAGGRVALKVFSPELASDDRVRASLFREIRHSASIRHDHIVPVIAAGESDGRAYLASCLIEGCDLRRAVAQAGGRLAPARACAILSQVASALDAAHAVGIVHRDVKPANVLLERVGGIERAYVCDFGLARDMAEPALAGGEGLVGTLAYVAPEQIRGNRVDGRADQYSLACVLFASLAGRPPFVRETDLGVVYAHLEEPPPRCSTLCGELPARVDDAIARGLAKDPQERYPSCSELVAAVKTALKPPRRASARGDRRRAVAGAIVAAVIACAFAVAAWASLATSARSRHAALHWNEVGLLDPANGSVRWIPTAGFVSDFAHGPAGHLVALEPFSRRVLVIDPRQRRVVRSIPIGIDPGGGPAFAAGRLWVSDPAERELLRIAPASGAIDRVALPRTGLTDSSEAGNTTLAAGSLWLADGLSMVERIDPASGRVIARVPVPGATNTVAGEGQLWAISSDMGSVFRIDPATNRVIARADIHPSMQGGAVAGGYLWVTLGSDGDVWKIAADGSVVTAVHVGGDPQIATASAADVWVANDAAKSIVRIDAITDAVRFYRMADVPSSVSVVGRQVVFSTSAPEPSLAALPPSGPRVIRIVMRQDFLANADPALLQTPAVAQLFYATCAKLYNYPDREGAAGATPRPEVATDPPRVSADGRTYSIDVRSGFRFSPPSGEPVDAETFAHVLERDLAPAEKSDYAARVFGDIIGATAYHEGDTRRLAGVTATPATLIIRLQRPSMDLMARLATSLGCAVPKHTPASNSPNGLGLIPMAGPYYEAGFNAGGWEILRRNPNYAGTRPRHLDAIVYEDTVPAGETTDRVAARTADIYTEFTPFPYPQDMMPGATPPVGTRLYWPVSMETRFLLVNARAGPFRDPRLRRAVSLALDRRALAVLWASRPAQHLIPPPLIGAAGPDGAARPRLAAARRLVAGRRVHVTLVTCRIPAPTCEQTAELVQAQLARIGINVDVHVEDDPWAAAALPHARVELLLGTWLLDFADAEAALSPVEPGVGAPGTFGDLTIGGRLDELARLDGVKRNVRVAGLARSLERAGLIDVYARTSYSELVSARLGCIVHNPLFPFVDLAAVCVKRG